MTDSPDEEFDAIIGGLDLGLSHEEITALEDEADQFHHEVTNCSTPELIKKLKEIWVELRKLGEGIYPQTEAGRELHSKHTAVKTEMLRRQNSNQG